MVNFAILFFTSFQEVFWSLSAHVSSFEMHIDQMNCYMYWWREVQMKVYWGGKRRKILLLLVYMYMLSGYILYWNSYVSSFLYFNSCLFISIYLNAPKLVYFYNSQSTYTSTKPCNSGVAHQLYNEDKWHVKSCYLIMQK